jgi:hypothetical protein
MVKKIKKKGVSAWQKLPFLLWILVVLYLISRYGSSRHLFVKEKITKIAKIKIAVRIHCIIVLIRGKDVGIILLLQVLPGFFFVQLHFHAYICRNEHL